MPSSSNAPLAFSAQARLLLATPLLLLASVGLAQRPAAADDEPFVPIHTAAADGGVEYGVWAAGPSYKVSFHDGATFVPMLGKDYPHNQPFRWRTVSARVGEVELVTQAPRLSYAELRAEYDLGSIVEAYDLRADGVEQTFVISERHGGGDLVIRGVLDSMLTTSNVAAAHQSLAFVDAQGKHLVSYGKATAVDADGHTLAMTTSHQAGEITLRLDANWLANAAYPVVVDPLLGIGTQIFGSTRDEVDLVRDTETTTASVWMAFSWWASSSDRDIYFRRFDDAGNFAANIYADITSNWSSQGARCAYGAGSEHAVVVFDRWFTGSSTRRLRYHRHIRTNAQFSTMVWPIATTDNAWRCDVGGTEEGASGAEVMVVWQQESNQGGAWQNTFGSGIRGCTLNLSIGFHGPVFPVSTSSLGDEERPRINEHATGTDPNNAHWLVTYQTYSTLAGPDDWDVGLRQVDLNGNVTSQMLLDNFSTDHKMTPVVAGSGSRYLVGFTTSTQAQVPGKPMGTEGHQLRFVRVDWDAGAASGSEPHGTVLHASYLFANARLADVAFDHESETHWSALYETVSSRTLWFATCGYLGQRLQNEVVRTANLQDAIVGGGLTYNEFEDQFMIGYGYNPAISSSWVAIDRFAYPAATPWSLSGTGCSSAQLSWNGSQLIGAESGSLEVSGAATNSLHVMLMATDIVSVPLVNIAPIQNGCWLLVPNAGAQYVGMFGLQVGANVSYSMPLPDYLDPDTFYFQDFHSTPGAAFELVSTQRLELPIIR